MVWYINEYDIANLRTASGERFVEFGDALIRAHAYTIRVPDSEVRTNLRINLGDGGVDTEVKVGTPLDPTGFFQTPSCWQYKAGSLRELSRSDLRKEVNKTFAKNLIQQGSAYRLCVCDSDTPQKRAELLEHLTIEVHQINPQAPDPLIVLTSDLASWANRYPAIVLRFFKPGLSEAQHLDAWGRNASNLTKTYVEVPDWTTVHSSILAHVGFDHGVLTTTLAVEGEAGVGKTRLVYETLAATRGARELVVYCTDDTIALRFATFLSNNDSTKAILVADDCPLVTRLKLDEILAGHRDRIRVIAIDATGETTIDIGANDQWLRQMPGDVINQILSQNFPHVPIDRRHAYGRLAGGFVRLAADLCDRDLLMQQSGGLGPALANVTNYFRSRLGEDDRRIVETLALFRKVGFSGDVKDELTTVCELLGLDRQHVVERVTTRLKDAPGFVAVAGRYFYVTPEIIARVAMNDGWRKWASSDPQEFIGRLKEPLLTPFIERVRMSGSPGVRQIVGDSFRHWLLGLGPTDLADSHVVGRVVAVVEIDPRTYLPTLEQLVSASPDNTFVAVGAAAFEKRAARRTLVSLANRLAAFPEFFSLSENILLKLSKVEVEPGISNNASRTWHQFFQIQLSGTAIPFPERLKLLEKRIYSDDSRIADLAIGAMGRLLVSSQIRIIGTGIVGGRLPPDEWRPHNWEEVRNCVSDIFDLWNRMVISEDTKLQRAVLNIVVQEMRELLKAGRLEETRKLVDYRPVPADILPKLISSIEDYLEYDGKRATHEDPLYARKVSDWLIQVTPTDLHGKLIAVVGQEPWHHLVRGDQDAWDEQIRSIAKAILKNPTTLHQEIQWLSGEDAKSAGILGRELGSLDSGGKLLDAILISTLSIGTNTFVRSYLGTLAERHPQFVNPINEALNLLEGQSPETAVDLAFAIGSVAHHVERARRLVRAELIPPTRLVGLLTLEGRRELNAEQLEDILTRLLSEIRNGDTRISHAVIEFAALGLLVNSGTGAHQSPSQEEIIRLVWNLIELTLPDGGRNSYLWGQILSGLATKDADRAAKIASAALTGDDFDQQEVAEGVLMTLAMSDPKAVMQSVGNEMLDEKKGIYFFIGSHRRIFSSLPTGVVEDWLRSAGVDGARRLARQVPSPYLDARGEPVVPDLTRFLLTEFETDDWTFREFCAGGHSLQLYQGDIPAQHLSEAAVARKFLSHPLRRIREWADIEIQTANQAAAHWQQTIDERSINS